jgi:uncharacterized membrane protein
MEISQAQFELLLEHLRDLTARVHRLEQQVGTQEPGADPRQPASAVISSPPRPSPPPAVPTLSESPQPPAPARQTSSDLETRIGSHWLNRIGIAAVLVGVSFFLKYAFENNWIGPSGRVVIGLLAGVAVVLWSERFRARGYHIFSYSLKALGIGVCYLSLWAAFQLYHLLPSGIVFAGMVMITAITSAMAFVQDTEVLAIFAIAGGFVTPVLISTGENRELALFTYVGLLDLAILALTAARSWRRISVLGFVGTLALYVSWYNEFYNRPQLATTLFFASMFFAFFAVAPFQIAKRNSASKVAIGLALLNGITYFLETYVMLYHVDPNQMAWFCVVLAVVYLLLARFPRAATTPGAGYELRLIHLALAMGLVTVTVPIGFEAHAITIGWLVEAAALLWVGGRLQSNLLNVFAILALVLGMVKLLLWDSFDVAQLIFNERMAAYVVAIVVLGFAAYQCSKRDDPNWRTVGAIAAIALNVVALRALSLEVHDYYARKMPLTPANVWRPQAFLQRRAVSIARDFTYSALWMAYGGMLMIIGFRRGSGFVRWQALVLIALTTIKVFVYDTSQLDRIYRILSFVVLGVLLLAISFAYQRNWLKLPSRKPA